MTRRPFARRNATPRPRREPARTYPRPVQHRVISIGTLSHHELWDKPTPQRPAHATTTLITTDKGNHILVDPALPAAALRQRLAERSGLDLADITAVFLTNFRPAHRLGLQGDALSHARLLIHEAERDAVGAQLVARLADETDPELRGLLEAEVRLLQRCKPAPDKLAAKVDLFPLPGYTPGTCGLLLSERDRTVLIAGDAVATEEHLMQGRVLRHALDIEAAQASLAEAVEIADVIIPGHGNAIQNPTRRPF